MNASEVNVKGQLKVGDGSFDGEISSATSADNNTLNLDVYSAISGQPILNLRRSDTNTVDALSPTDDNDTIGTIQWWGVDNGSVRDLVGSIRVIQEGASAANIVGSMFFQTGDGLHLQQLVLHGGGNVGVSMPSSGLPSYAFSIGSTDFSDQMGFYHDNTDAYMKWEDGSLFLQTDEGFNTDGIVGILGKGTGEAFLGVGVAAPERQFHLMVSDASLTPQWAYSSLLIEENAATGEGTGIEILTPNDAFGGITFSDGNSGPDGAIWYYHATDKMHFRTAATIGTEMVLDASGQLGVLTASPAYPLEVTGDVSIIGAGNLRMENGEYLIWKDNGGTGRSTITVNSGDDVSIGSSALDDVKFLVGTKGAAVWIKDTTGYMGVNTDTPDGTLHVEGDCFFGDKEGNGDYSTFEADGTLEFNGDATVWDDYVTPLGPNNWNGLSNNPTLTKLFDDGSGSQGVYGYVYSDGDESLITVQLPHRWKEGTTIYPHIHFMCTSDVDPTAKFGVEFEYAWADIGEDFPANSTLSTIDIDTGVDTDNMHQIANVTAAGIDGTGHTISSVLLCRIKRVASSVSGTNYVDGVVFLDFDIHYEIDTVGSRQITTK